MQLITRLFSISAVILGTSAAFACSGDFTAPEPQMAVTSTEQPTELNECRPDQYAYAISWVGPNGGTLKAGKHVLTIPAGALRSVTLITMKVYPDTVRRVALKPDGLTFNKRHPARLVMNYQSCVVDPGTVQRVGQVDASLRIIETPPSTNDPWTQTVTAELAHFSDYVVFSTYAVAY